MRRILLSLQMILVVMQSMQGQSELRFDNYYLEDGLPNSRARTVFQDSIGWIWVGTGGGLSRFDGISFKTYQLDNYPGEETTFSIWCIWEDADSRLWIGTENQGMVLYQRDLDRFKHYIHNDSCSNCISSNQVYSITSDSSGIMWIGTAGGLNRFDPVTNSFQLIRQQSDSSPTISSDTIYDLFVDGDNRLWIGTHRGLDFLDLESDRITNYKLNSVVEPALVPSNRIENICQDENGNILVASYYSGLYVIEPSLERSVNIIPEPDYQRSYLVRAVYPDLNGELWLGTRGGIYILDKDYDVIAHYEKSLQDPNSLGHNSVSDIYRDRTGDVWIATRSGLSYANMQNRAFKYYGARIGDSKYLNDPEIYSIYQSRDGKIWMGTEAGGVNILDPKTDHFTYLTHDESNPNSISSNSIKAIIQDRRGNFWIGTFLGGLDQYNVKEKKIIHYKNDPEDENSLINNIIWAPA